MTPTQPRGGNALTALASALERGGDPSPAPGDEIAMILQADELAKLSQARLHELVAVARGRGYSWAAIGDALGVSRQAAFKRFTSTSPTGLEGTPMPEPVDLIRRTTDVFESLDAGDYDAVKAHMTYTCSRALPKRKVMGVWQAVTTASGRLEVCTDVTVQTPDGRSTLEKFTNRHLLGGPVVQATLRHEAGEWIGRVSYNGMGKITGLLIAPPESRDLPF